MRQIQDYLYGSRGPWPQPSPRFPFGMPPAVTSIPWAEQGDFTIHVLSRLHFTDKRFRKTAKKFAAKNSVPPAIDDREFVRLLTDTAMSRVLCPILDPVDREIFADVLEVNRNATVFKADLAALKGITPMRGCYLEPTITLLARDGDSFKPLAIHINNLVLKPTDSHAWSLAKHFVLQGMALQQIVGGHPLLHFPMDAINAISKTVLPKEHLLLKLLLPHTRFSLMLNDRVLEHPRTVLNNNQEEVYTPFPCETDAIRGIAKAVYAGIPGNSGYPGYRFTLRPPKFYSDYGTFVEAYYDVIYRFVSEVVARIPHGDRSVVEWAEYISQHIPGFPNGSEIFHEDNLAAAATFYICDVSVMHAADHYSFAEQPINKVPVRLRVPPPSSKDMRAFDPKRLVTEDDISRQKMAHEMFFKPHNVTLLHDTRYEFGDRELEALNDRFLRELKRLDETMPVKRYIPLNEISRSLQY